MYIIVFRKKVFFTNPTENTLLHGPVRPALLRYALPIILSMVATQFYSVADTMIIGLRLDADALAAVTVGLKLGVTPEHIRKALDEFQNMSGRQEIFEAKGCTIINDCYNAGPESMAAALNVLGNRPGRHLAVLGEMLELGDCAQAEHYKIGRIAAEKADMVFAYGPHAGRVLDGTITGGMPEPMGRAFDDPMEMAAALKRSAKPGDVILFKASRGMHLEKVLKAFLEEEK